MALIPASWLSFNVGILPAIGRPAQLERENVSTADTYRTSLTRVCRTANEKGKRLGDIYRATPLHLVVDMERDELAKVESLAPSSELRIPHEQLLAAWRDRLEILQDMVNHANLGMRGPELQVYMSRADELTRPMNDAFQIVGAPECQF
jgi:hypothetical protein